MDKNTLDFFEIFIPVLATVLGSLYAIVRYFQTQLEKSITRERELYASTVKHNQEEIDRLQKAVNTIPSLEARMKSLEETVSQYKEQTVFLRGQMEAYKHAFDAIQADRSLLNL